MIKIGPLIATDYGQVSALLHLQEEPVVEVTPLTQSSIVLRSFAFWQHWLPCQYHVTASVYVAREEGDIVGLVSLHNVGKGKTCWRVDHLVVHPEHRGRGIAQELLRYVFAQFGSQGVLHFLAEVANNNDAALSLFASCGFCRSSQVTYYQLNDAARQDEPLAVEEDFHIATPSQRQRLYQLHQDVLPPDLRLVLSQSPEDFAVSEQLPYTSVEKSKHKLMRKRQWYWVSEDLDRKTITAAVKVTAEPALGYRLDFAVHPGWKHLSAGIVNFAVNSLLAEGIPRMPIWARVYDFQGDVAETLKARSFDRTGEYFLLAREHWQRSKRLSKRKADATVPIPNIAKPAINLPLATERHTTAQ
jgi:N-acetylglutamate synthase-like GNAT family acetyltransferase